MEMVRRYERELEVVMKMKIVLEVGVALRGVRRE